MDGLPSTCKKKNKVIIFLLNFYLQMWTNVRWTTETAVKTLSVRTFWVATIAPVQLDSTEMHLTAQVSPCPVQFN